MVPTDAITGPQGQYCWPPNAISGGPHASKYSVDLVVLLTEGRGGKFVPDGEKLRYLPSGREPVLHIGSRRGVPYRSKVTTQQLGDTTRLEYLGVAFHESVAASQMSLDFDADVWPLVAAELLTGYYRELFTGHPELVRGEWGVFAREQRSHPYRPAR